MHEIGQLLHNLIDPEWISHHGGLWLVVFIVFAETGLFIGFFLPGDSLLFVAGLIIARTKVAAMIAPGVPDLLFWITLVIIAGIIGNFVGYWFGRKSGPLLFERRETWLFKRRHLIAAKEFYEKKGGFAIVVARFLPIVRTFAPIVGGVVKMEFRAFALYNVIGSVAWVGSLMTAGYLLGEVPWVQNNLEKIIIGIVLVTTVPILAKMIFGKKKHPVQQVAEDVVE